MESILYQIFRGEYDITPKPDKTQQEIRKELFAELDKVEAALGPGFLDHLFDLDGELEDRACFQFYRAGFVLGANLMLEALRAD